MSGWGEMEGDTTMNEQSHDLSLEPLALPFVVQERDGRRTIPEKSVALASLFSLLDSQRKRRGTFVFIICALAVIVVASIAGIFYRYLFLGLLLGLGLLVAALWLRAATRRHRDKLIYVSLVNWPFTLIKRSDTDKHALFDTLNLFSSTFHHDVIPTVGDFISQVNLDPRDIAVPTFIDRLDAYGGAFKDFAGSALQTFQGCVNESRLMEQLLDVGGLESSADGVGGAFTLSPKTALHTMTHSLDALIEMKAQARQDADELSTAAEAALSAASRWDGYLTEQQNEIKRHYDVEIERIRPDIEKRVAAYQVQLETETQSVTARTRPLIDSLQTDFSRWESEEDNFKRKGDAYHREEASARRMKERITDQLKRVQRERQAEISKIKDRHDRLMNQEWDRIGSLEKERDQQVKELENSKSEISERLGKIRGELRNLIERKNDLITSIDEISMETSPELQARYGDRPFSLHVPICIAKFENKESRFFVASPLLLKRKVRTLGTLKRALGDFALPLEPQSIVFEQELARRLEKALSSDQDLRREIEETCPNRDLVRETGMKEVITQGVIELRDLGWIEDKQCQALLASIRELYGIYESGALWSGR